MTGKELKEWAAEISDNAGIEVKRYDWEALEPEKIRAIFTCSPKQPTETNKEDIAHV